MFRRGTVLSETRVFFLPQRVSVKRYGIRDEEAKRVSEPTECLRCSFTDTLVDFVLTAMEISCADVTRPLRHVALHALLDIYCPFRRLTCFLTWFEWLVVGHSYFMPH